MTCKNCGNKSAEALYYANGEPFGCEKCVEEVNEADYDKMLEEENICYEEDCKRNEKIEVWIDEQES